MTPSSIKIRLACLPLIVFALHPVTPAGFPNQGEKDPRAEKVDKFFAQWDKPDSPGCELYLPEIPQYEAPITIRHLIHHTSGIRDYLTLMSIAGQRDDDYYVYLADQFKAEAMGAQKPEAKFIELPEQDLKDKAGAYRNQINGVIWKLYVKDGKLFADVPNLSIRFGAVSATEFRSIGTPVEFALRFEKQGQTPALRMQRGADKPVTLEAVQLVTPTPAQLAEYTGDYRSDEVQVTYRIVLESGKLFLRHENEYKGYPKNPLEPTTSDTFFVQGTSLRFTRDARKQVSAFTLNAGRVKNIRFVKKAI